MAALRKDQSAALQFYRFSPGDTVASIGAQACNWEAAYAAACDSIFFYLEDIDTVYCNAPQAALAWQYYAALPGSSAMGGHAIVTGDEKSTHLPPISCDKILIINSFHEFSCPVYMLRDIAAKLKKQGLLFIDETLAMYTGELHTACHKPMPTEEELIQVVESTGFKYVKSVTLAWHKGKPGRKIFAFCIK